MVTPMSTQVSNAERWRRLTESIAQGERRRREGLARDLLSRPADDRDDEWWDRIDCLAVDTEERIAEEGSGRPDWLEDLYEVLEQRLSDRPKLAVIAGGLAEAEN